MRGLLFEAASSLIRQVRRFSPLKSWAVRLAGRRGYKKTATATARKIAVLILTLWKGSVQDTCKIWSQGPAGAERTKIETFKAQ